MPDSGREIPRAARDLRKIAGESRKPFGELLNTAADSRKGSGDFPGGFRETRQPTGEKLCAARETFLRARGGSGAKKAPGDSSGAPLLFAVPGSPRIPARFFH